MAKSWDERWLRANGGDILGGQGLSFVATAKDGSGLRVFVKTLRSHRVRDRRARKRFKREAVAYETLAGLGLPQLFDHNAESCEDGRTPMYMAMELIEGVNLQVRVQRDGRADVDAALACVRELGAVLTRCHENGVTHRDIKPANIVLRGGDITTPVLVDFGLSFNDADEDDLTRLNEEVGNRFLRLPEHSSGGRGAASDVTQLAGIFLYTLTGHEPRVLRDEFGQMPHERPNTQGVLKDVLTSRQFLRLMSVFGRAFAIELLARYQTASELVAGLESAVRSDPEENDDLQHLIDRVDEIAVSRVPSASLREQPELLWKFVISDLGNIYKNLADPRGLHGRHSGTTVQVNTDEQWQETRMSLAIPGEEPKAWTTYRVDRRGNEYVVRIDLEISRWSGWASDVW